MEEFRRHLRVDLDTDMSCEPGTEINGDQCPNFLISDVALISEMSHERVSDAGWTLRLARSCSVMHQFRSVRHQFRSVGNPILGGPQSVRCQVLLFISLSQISNFIQSQDPAQ